MVPIFGMLSCHTLSNLEEQCLELLIDLIDFIDKENASYRSAGSEFERR